MTSSAYHDPFVESTSSGVARAAGTQTTGAANAPAAPAPSPRRFGLATAQSVWVAGALVALAILLTGLLRLAWIAAHAHRITQGRWFDLAQEISHGYGLRHPVVLLQSRHPPLLVTWGLANPKVILPIAVDTWTDERARVVLSHELAHICRGDWVVQLSAELLRAFYWFNPLVWAACRRLRLESEHACDDEVMSRGVLKGEFALCYPTVSIALRSPHAPARSLLSCCLPPRLWLRPCRAASSALLERSATKALAVFLTSPSRSRTRRDRRSTK